jgi:uncharacterized membrane protein
MNNSRARFFNLLSVCALIGLLVHCLLWELWLAPLHPGGSTLVLKALPLLLPLFGLLHGKRYTHQWMSLFSLIYLAEGLVRIGSDPIEQRWAPALEVLLALLLFIGVVGFAKTSGLGKPHDADKTTAAD